MRSFKSVYACLLLVLTQTFGSLGLTSANVSAQAEQLVAVVIGEKSRDACEVQSRRSNDGNWGAQTIVGPPVACEGGLVAAFVMTQEEASQEVARTEITAESAELTEVSVIPLTGDAGSDEAAIRTEIEAIHAMFSPAVSTEDDDSLGFMAPRALEDFALNRSTPGASVLAAQCRNGNTNQERRRDTRFRSPGTQAVVLARIYYKRVSCAHWRITDVKMTLVRPPDQHWVWFRNFYYNRAWFGDRYGDREAGKQCSLLYEDQWTNFRPGWVIQAGGSAQFEAVDSNPWTPGVIPSCWSGAGTSFVSFKIFLPGGRS